MSALGLPRAILRGWLVLPASLRALAPIAVMLLLWYSSSLPPANRPPNILLDFLHNGAHIIAYGTLAGTWLLLASHTGLVGPQARMPWSWLSVGLSTAYGVVDELHQAYVPGRVSSFGDLLSDCSGGMLGVIVLLALLRADVRLAKRIPWCLLCCLGCVSIATWLPW